MPLDAPVIYALLRELKPQLEGGRIDRIQMPEKNVLIFSLRCSGKNRRLLVSSNVGTARMHLTDRSYENPQEPPMFCMLLRKYLNGAILSSMEQPAFDRICILHFSTRDELGAVSQAKLAIEMMSRFPNLVLINSQGNILDCLRRTELTEKGSRALLPGMLYQVPPRQNKVNFLTCAEGDIPRVWIQAPDAASLEEKILRTFSGLSPLTARELVYRCHGDDSSLPDALEALRETVLQGGDEPVLLCRDGKPFDFSFFRISQYQDSAEIIPCSSYSEMLDTFYSERERQEELKRRAKSLSSNIKTARNRTARKLAARRQELEKAEDREAVRRRADLIKANLYRLKRGMENFTCEDFYDPSCQEVVIPLDPLQSPQQNAEKLYRKYTKLKTAEQHLHVLIAENEQQLNYLESVLSEIDMAESASELQAIRQELQNAGYLRQKKESRKERPMRSAPYAFRTTDGFEVLVGRNNAMNDSLTQHTARRTDYWLHAQKIHGSHVILRCEGREPTETALREAAELAAYYSQARNSGNIPVDSTMVRNVKKPGGSLPGFVTYEKYKTVYADSGGGGIEKRKEKESGSRNQ